MKGQAKALIPASIGIITLLLTGITGCVCTPGEQQAINIAETRAVTIEQYRNQELGAAFRMEADEVVRRTGQRIATELKTELKVNAAPTLAAAESVHRDKG